MREPGECSRVLLKELYPPNDMNDRGDQDTEFAGTPGIEKWGGEYLGFRENVLTNMGKLQETRRKRAVGSKALQDWKKLYKREEARAH